MLGKLIKHEFRATGRIMLPVMGAMLVLALLANLSIRGLMGAVSDVAVLRFVFVLLVIFFVIAIIATAVMALILMVSRFYQNLLKDEGYLMFTLPVSEHSLIWSKLIVSSVWFLVTGVLIFLVLMLTVMNLSETNLQMLFERMPTPDQIRAALDRLGIRGQLNTVVLQGLLLTILYTVSNCLHFYAAMALGHMFSKNKILLSIVFYVLISFVFNLMFMSLGGMMGMNMESTGLEEAKEVLGFVSSAMRQGILIVTLQAAILYIATALGLKRGLNLG